MPELEGVPFALLGATTIAFSRIGPQDDAFEGTYVVDAAARRITSTNVPMRSPSISPDGQRLAYRWLTTTNTSTFWDIYVARADGTGEQLVVSAAGNVEGPPAWSPDGRLVHALLEVDATLVPPAQVSRIYRQSPSQGAADRQALAGFRSLPGDVVCVWDDSRPSVAPGGALLLTCRTPGLYRLEPGAAAPVEIYRVPADEESHVAVRAAAWSPDGARVAFLEVREPFGAPDGFTRLRIASADGSGVVTVATVPIPDPEIVTRPGFGVWSLCWTTDGGSIVFTAPDGFATSHVHVAPAGGGPATPLTTRSGVADGSVSCTR